MVGTVRASAASTSTAATPITIGWAFDSKGNMAPFDNPALAAAKMRVGGQEAAAFAGTR